MASLKGLFRKELTMMDLLQDRRVVEEALAKEDLEILGAGTGAESSDISVVINGTEYWLELKPVS